MSFETVLTHEDQTPTPGAWDEKCAVPTHHFTTQQLLWVLKHTLGNAMICFGVNFAIVTLAFYGKKDVSLFAFPSTVAGAYALTMLIEISVSWLLTGIIMTLEITTGRIPPLDPTCIPWWPKHKPSESSIFQYSNMTDIIIPPTPNHHALTCTDRTRRFIDLQLRSTPWIVFVALVVLPVFTAVTYALYGLHEYNDFPQPQILVGLFGALIALITMPFWSLNTLAYVGYRMIEEK